MYEVGDTVYGSFGRYGKIDVREGKVVKVTKTGRVNVDFNMQFYDGTPRIIQFGSSGMQIGGDRWNSYFLIDRYRYEHMRDKQIAEAAVAAFRDQCGRTNFEDKNDILKFIEELRDLADKIPESWKPRR